MGLMRRVLTQTRTTTERHDDERSLPDEHEPAQSLQPELVIRSILLELNDIPPSVEAPSHAFSLLKRSLSLEKSAILLPDPDESTFVPWALNGFDVTTQRRLHIPEATAYEFFPNRASRFVLLSGADRAPFEQFFSVREFSTAQHIALAPFFYQAKLLAILVITATPYFDLDHTILQIMYSAYEGSISSLFFRSRELPISRIQLPLLYQHQQLFAVAYGLLAESSAEEVRLLFLEFRIEKAVRIICGKTRETDEYRVKQDILRFLDTMLASFGKIFFFPDQRLVLLRVETEGDRALDVELLSHQINRRLQGIFPELRAEDEVVGCRLLSYPQDSSDLEELTARFT